MTKPRLFITQPVFPEHEALLGTHFSVTVNRDDSAVMRPGALAGAIRDCAYLFCRLGDPVTAEVIAAAPDLRCIATMATCPSHIDLSAAARAGVTVIARRNSLDGETVADNTGDTADLAFGLLLALGRGIVRGSRAMAAGEFPGPQSHRYAGPAVRGARLGLIGMGAVATHMAWRARGFGMCVSYWSRSRKRSQEADIGIEFAELEALLAQADYVSVHLAGCPETRHFLNTARIALMRPSAMLINTARGDIVDQEALFRALREKTLAGAALDVFADEPWPSVPHDLVDSGALLATPHLGSAVAATRVMMERIVCRNLIDVLQQAR